MNNHQIQKIRELPQHQLAEFVISILTDIMKKEYSPDYSGTDILTCMHFDLKQRCVCGDRFMKIRNTLKEVL